MIYTAIELTHKQQQQKEKQDTYNLQRTDAAKSEPEGRTLDVHTKWTEWGMKCVLKQGTWGFPFLWVCVFVRISTQSHDLHLQIKNNILLWTLGTDSETNKLQVQTWNESKIEFHFRIHICPHWLHRIVQCLWSRRNRSVSENHPTVPEQFRPDQTGHSVLKTPH